MGAADGVFVTEIIYCKYALFLIVHFANWHDVSLSEIWHVKESALIVDQIRANIMGSLWIYSTQLTRLEKTPGPDFDVCIAPSKPRLTVHHKQMAVKVRE